MEEDSGDRQETVLWGRHGEQNTPWTELWSNFLLAFQEKSCNNFVCLLFWGFVFRMLLVVSVCFMKRVLPGHWEAPCRPGTTVPTTPTVPMPQPPQHSWQSKTSPDIAKCPPGAKPALLNATALKRKEI